MLLKSLSIKNYKSLRDVTFTPTPISALVGPNSSGKTNFADAIEFLSEVYSLGLEMAIARKGGYENIAFRRQKRSKAPIEFEITLDIDEEEKAKLIESTTGFGAEFPTLFLKGEEKKRFFKFLLKLRNFQARRFRLLHKFSIVATGSGIKADFEMREETICLLVSDEHNENQYSTILTSSRKYDSDAIKSLAQSVSERGSILDRYMMENIVASLFLGTWGLFGGSFYYPISNARVYNFPTLHSRMPGVPTPNPELSKSGENLPALVDWLQREHPDRWQIVMSGMKEILPTLNNISVQYLHTKTLGLFFDEEGFGRAWAIEDMSDGTVHALSMLVAAVDPRSNLLVIEEPENSVHPWILRVIVQKFREVSATKRIILTSHSPVLINLLKPEEIWITSRKDGETHLDKLIDLAPSVNESWREGAYQLADLLDSGSIPQAVPGGVY